MGTINHIPSKGLAVPLRHRSSALQEAPGPYLLPSFLSGAKSSALNSNASFRMAPAHSSVLSVELLLGMSPLGLRSPPSEDSKPQRGSLAWAQGESLPTHLHLLQGVLRVAHLRRGDGGVIGVRLQAALVGRVPLVAWGLLFKETSVKSEHELMS